jgi:hypothetical protein
LLRLPTDVDKAEDEAPSSAVESAAVLELH